MQLPSKAELLRIFIGESDKHKGRPLYEVIVEAAREAGLAGATVLRSTLGFGASSRLHSAKVLRLSEDLPMVIEIVDKPERIEDFLPLLEEFFKNGAGGLITVEDIRVITYQPNDKDKEA